MLTSLNPIATACSSWPGWAGVKYFFTFGDSYTATGFNATTGPQPNPVNPLGNPPYPGDTSSDGPNWVGFLSTTYNESFILTYNFAYDGAAVDAGLVPPYLPTATSMKQQVQNEFLPRYGNRPSSAPWASDDSLFAFFIGINDIGNSYTQKNESNVQAGIFVEYAGLLEQVYAAGARNFLFLNVPPVERAPAALEYGAGDQMIEGAAILEWNGRLLKVARQLRGKHADVTIFALDTYSIFNAVLNNPKAFPQTAGYRNTTRYCATYMNGTPNMTSFSPSCGLPVNEYFWLNQLHPTYPMHDAMAAHIANLLEDVPPGGVGCNCSGRDDGNGHENRKCKGQRGKEAGLCFE